MGLIQPFVNYNFKGGLYLDSSPIITVDWKAQTDSSGPCHWVAEIGKIFHFGKLPVIRSSARYYNVCPSRQPAPTGRFAPRCSWCFRSNGPLDGSM